VSLNSYPCQWQRILALLELCSTRNKNLPLGLTLWICPPYYMSVNLTACVCWHSAALIQHVTTDRQTFIKRWTDRRFQEAVLSDCTYNIFPTLLLQSLLSIMKAVRIVEERTISKVGLLSQFFALYVPTKTSFVFWRSVISHSF
jgi:hypothetical protein